MIKIICKECGKEFIAKNGSKKKFCSRECYNNYIKKHGNRREKHLVEVQCAECGKTEFVYQSRAKKYVCCSVECLGKYNSKKYSKRVKLICPICGEEYECKQSKINSHKTCGKPECRTKWLKLTRVGSGNANYKTVEDLLRKQAIDKNNASKTLYQHVVKEYLGLGSIVSLPKGYVIHHKDANHDNNIPENLVVLPKTTHRLIHTWFGNVLISALHTGKITREMFFNLCNNEQKEFYKNIIDLNVTHQAVVKQGELLEPLEEGNQQPSIYRNIFEGSTTNSRVLTNNIEDSNADTSALPIRNNGGEIV